MIWGASPNLKINEFSLLNFWCPYTTHTYTHIVSSYSDKDQILEVVSPWNLLAFSFNISAHRPIISRLGNLLYLVPTMKSKNNSHSHLRWEKECEKSLFLVYKLPSLELNMEKSLCSLCSSNYSHTMALVAHITGGYTCSLLSSWIINFNAKTCILFTNIYCCKHVFRAPH